MAFHLDDYQKTYLAWRFLREIAKWNASGSINPKDPEFPTVNSPTAGEELHCPECQAIVGSQQKFCGECGAKLTTSAA
jgi:hypothetical protein